VFFESSRSLKHLQSDRSLLWDILQHGLVVMNRLFGTTYWTRLLRLPDP